MTGREKFGKYKKAITFLSFLFSIFPEALLLLLFDFFRAWPTRVGVMLRYVVLKNIAQHIGDNVYIAPHVVLKSVSGLRLGDNVSVHEFCYIDAAGGVVIGDNVSIAHATSLISFDHSFENASVPIKYNPTVLGRIEIEKDVWVGCGVRLLRSVTINTRSVIAAGAVVRAGNYPANSLIAGVPAKVIKNI